MNQPPYTINFTEDAVSNLGKLDRSVASRIVKKFEWLAANAETVPHTPLKGQWQRYYKLRIGDYRAIYFLDVNAHSILVIKVGHRSEIYEE